MTCHTINFASSCELFPLIQNELYFISEKISKWGHEAVILKLVQESISCNVYLKSYTVC